MESLLAQLTRKQRGRLRVVTVDADSSRPLADAFAVADIPTLVLLRETFATAKRWKRLRRRATIEPTDLGGQSCG
jgi:thioredoxin-like negative regulator of GroEL